MTTASPQKKQKQVRWGTITALEFCIGHSACSVPGSAGPPIGLVGSPIRYTVSSISDADEDVDSSSNSSSVNVTVNDTDVHTAHSPRGKRHRRQQEYWICPMERVQILAEEDGHSLDEITQICSDVSALLDARAFSKFDHVAHHILETLEMSRCDDLRKLRQTYHQDNRKKIVLF